MTTQLKQAAQKALTDEQIDAVARSLGIAYGGREFDIRSIARAAALLHQEAGEAKKLWLWKNFVDGRPEYWAFDNPYPCVTAGGDPLTLGEPCGYAIVKQSVNGRPDVSEEKVLAATATRQGTQ